LGAEVATSGAKLASSIGCQFLVGLSPLLAERNAATLRQTQLDYFHGGPLEILQNIEGIYPAFWALVRESLVVGNIPRHYKELIAVQVSALNKCPFCTEAHGTVSRYIPGVTEQLLKSVQENDLSTIPDLDFKQYAQWTQGQNGIDQTSSPGFFADLPRPMQVELKSVVLVTNMANRIVDLFGAETMDLPNNPAMKKALELFINASYSLERKPGLSLALLDPFPARDGLRWAEGNENIHATLVRASGTIEAAAGKFIPSAVRDYLNIWFSRWDGKSQIPVSKLKAVKILGESPQMTSAEAALAEFLLRSAFASFSLKTKDQEIWTEVAKNYPQNALKTMVAWAAFQVSNKLVSR
jgi:AhpD family alkylhydroperoxidase